MNILIVEDDTAIREGVAEFLKENEYEVFCAGDGEKALEILKSKEIHLALLDIMLPKKNGIEVLKELRTFSELPVIMLTAVTDEETQVQTFDNLADDYICKPFSLILLLSGSKHFCGHVIRRKIHGNTKMLWWIFPGIGQRILEKMRQSHQKRSNF